MGWEAIVIYVFTGCIAGILSGLLGISGGIVTVPMLLASFSFLDFPEGSQMHVALGTSLASMVFNALSSSMAHHRKGGVLWSVVRSMMPGIFVGSLIGAWIAYMTSEFALEVIFGSFLLLLGGYFLKKHHPPEGEHRLPSPLVQSTIGSGIGGICNILGIGGGVFFVPLLSYFHVPFKKAVGTSAFLGAWISFIGAIFYTYLGSKVDTSIPYCIGFLYLPAFAIVSCVSFGMAIVGVKLAHRWPTRILRRIFACVLILVGSSMLLQYLDLLESL